MKTFSPTAAVLVFSLAMVPALEKDVQLRELSMKTTSVVGRGPSGFPSLLTSNTTLSETSTTLAQLSLKFTSLTSSNTATRFTHLRMKMSSGASSLAPIARSLASRRPTVAALRLALTSSSSGAVRTLTAPLSLMSVTRRRTSFRVAPIGLRKLVRRSLRFRSDFQRLGSSTRLRRVPRSPKIWAT